MELSQRILARIDSGKLFDIREEQTYLSPTRPFRVIPIASVPFVFKFVKAEGLPELIDGRRIEAEFLLQLSTTEIFDRVVSAGDGGGPGRSSLRQGGEMLIFFAP